MLKIKGIISTLDVVKDEFSNDYLEGTIDVPRSSGVIDTIYFRTEYEQMKYLHFCDSYNTNQSLILSGSLRTYATGKEFPRYRTVLYVRDYSVSTIEGDLNEFIGWLEVLHVGDIRLTPAGTRILDSVVFSNRSTGMKDKISLISFGNTAEFFKYNVEPGMKIKVVGRFQSRQYNKIVDNDVSITVTTNELVANYITVPGGEYSKEV